MNVVLSFKESLTLLLIGGLFIILAATLKLDQLAAIGPGAIVIVLILQLVGGPARAWVSAIGSSLDWREKLFIGWVFPRGIVAAAVSSLFALRLSDMGYPGADLLVPLVFSVIIGTVIIQSVSTRLVAKILNVAEPEPSGVLVVGANPLGRAMALAFSELGKAVRVTDSHWASIRRARMAGLPVFYGSPVSSYAESNLDLTGIGTLLAVSRQPGLNELSCVRFSEEFGRDHVFTMATNRESGHEKHSVTGELSGRMLLRGERTVDELVAKLRSGAELKVNELTDAFDIEAYRERYPGAVVLFGINAVGELCFPVADQDFAPTPGWQVGALLDADDRERGSS